jgi:hypothetical protein
VPGYGQETARRSLQSSSATGHPSTSTDFNHGGLREIGRTLRIADGSNSFGKPLRPPPSSVASVIEICLKVASRCGGEASSVGLGRGVLPGLLLPAILPAAADRDGRRPRGDGPGPHRRAVAGDAFHVKRPPPGPPDSPAFHVKRRGVMFPYWGVRQRKTA